MEMRSPFFIGMKIHSRQIKVRISYTPVFNILKYYDVGVITPVWISRLNGIVNSCSLKIAYFVVLSWYTAHRLIFVAILQHFLMLSPDLGHTCQSLFDMWTASWNSMHRLWIQRTDGHAFFPSEDCQHGISFEEWKAGSLLRSEALHSSYLLHPVYVAGFGLGLWMMRRLWQSLLFCRSSQYTYPCMGSSDSRLPGRWPSSGHSHTDRCSLSVQCLPDTG